MSFEDAGPFVWHHKDTNPLVAKVIRARHAACNGWVPWIDIRNGLIDDPEAKAFIDDVATKQEKTPEFVASHFVAGWGKSFTFGYPRNEFVDDFDRKGVGTAALYRPKSLRHVTRTS